MAGLQGFASRGSSLYLAPVFLGVRGVSYMGVRQDPMCSPTEAWVLAFMGILAFISVMAGLPGFASHGSSLYLGAGFQQWKLLDIHLVMQLIQG